MDKLVVARTNLNTKMVEVDSDVNLLINDKRASTLVVADTMNNTLMSLITGTKSDVNTMIGD